MNNTYAFPETMTADVFKTIRTYVGMNKKEFADFCDVSQKTISRYESGTAKIDGPISRLLYLLYLDLVDVKKLEVPAKEYNVRFLYKCNGLICSVIDVDDIKKRIKVKNFTNSTNLKAFGDNPNPTYDDYLSLLEERCVPKTRHLIGEYLKYIGVPFYDPFLIVMKTKGIMEGDFFSLEFVD